MIYTSNQKYPVFMLSTRETSYIFGITDEGLCEHMAYTSLIPLPDEKNRESLFNSMKEKVSHGKGTTINYNKLSQTVTEDVLFELSSVGKGDLREPMLLFEYEDGSRTSDFIYSGYEIPAEPKLINNLPCADAVLNAKENGNSEQLIIKYKERYKDIYVYLYYTVFYDCDVITRRVVIENKSQTRIRILKAMSMQLDFDDNGYKITSFGGNWAREMHKSDTILEHGSFVISQRAGVSSNRANPFVMCADRNVTEDYGECYAFNLVYSGDHYESFSVSGFGKTRFLSGINHETTSFVISAGESFETPEAVMTYTKYGYNGISRNMHKFVRKYIVRGTYKEKNRPILLNSWEAAYFNISMSSLLKLAKKGKEAGVELFVMDDGWFKGRNNDKTSLGDWVVDTKKLRGGVEELAQKVHELGLQFGIWVEPEMISEDSDLYRAHPEYAMTIPGRDNSPGRNQMLLDIANKEVADYIKNAMRNVFSIKGVNYVKWDMNRMFADVYSKVLHPEKQGETMHRYYVNLYDIMKCLTEEFPDILFEGCASGGNRFDLGILCYMPQIWGSDDTDAIQRVEIQTGYSYGYPMSTVTAHVSACPNHQTLRNTPLDTRFNIAAFGVLGYEINLCECKDKEFDEIKNQINLYKSWREVFFRGDFYRIDDEEWMVVSPDKKKAVAVIWNKFTEPNSFYKKLKCKGLNEEYMYHVYNIPLEYDLKMFGDLVNQVAPIHIKKDSLSHDIISHFVKLHGEKEDYCLSGAALNSAGIKLMQAFGGTGFNEETRVFTDFSSRMYFFENM